jgi:hypothetical protein
MKTEITESKILNIESLSNGIYFIKSESQNKYFGKFIKE